MRERKNTMAALGKKKKASEFPDVIPVSEAIRKGDIFTKLTCLIMGAGNLARKQIIQGLLFLAGELAYILYMVFYGAKALQNFVTLGTETQRKVFNEATQVYEYATGDNSQLCLLYGVITLFVTIGFILLWRGAIRSSYIAQKAQEAGKKPITFGEVLKSLKDNRMYQLFLFFPFMGVLLFTVMPLVFMILMAFTNYDHDHLPPGQLFDWVGFQNFTKVLNAGGALGETFWKVLGWTIIWAIFATFLNYIFGIILAIIINRDGTKFKAFWRFIFVLTIAVPQFVSLLVVNTMIQQHGVINLLLKELFGVGPLPFLTNVTWARVTVIVVNLWVGIPYTLLTVTGILKNIPAELYEAAKVDGANSVTTLFRIIIPSVMPSVTICLFLTITNSFKLFDQNLALTAGAPGDRTQMVALDIYNTFYSRNGYEGVGQAKAVIFFIIVAVIALLQMRLTRRKEVES